VQAISPQEFVLQLFVSVLPGIFVGIPLGTYLYQKIPASISQWMIWCYNFVLIVIGFYSFANSHMFSSSTFLVFIFCCGLGICVLWIIDSCSSSADGSSELSQTIDELQDKRRKRTISIVRRKSSTAEPSRSFFRKYFCEGQLIDEAELERSKRLEEIASSLPLFERILFKYRKQVGMAIPFFIIHIFWWTYMISTQSFYLFETRYFISIVMIFGSMVAGATSEGGGASNRFI
jgi:hypothetical protein